MNEKLNPDQPLDPSLVSTGAKCNPLSTLGVSGTVIYGGHINDNERNPVLSNRESKYRTYSDILANTSIVAAGTRYFLNLLSKAAWSFIPAEADTSGKYSELIEDILFNDPATPWHRIVRRASMFRFYGFSLQEWTAKKRSDGVITFSDISPRPQLTISKWDVTVSGTVNGIVQESPQDLRSIYIPRSKLLYIVDDTLNDSPEGLGLFRHLVSPAHRLERYLQLEGFGFETDLRGIPVGRGPFTELSELVASGKITQDQRTKLEAPLRSFIERHIKSDRLGMMIDSITYETQDGYNRPSNQRQWDIELLKGSPTSLKENAEAIERLNHEMARILGVDQLFLGSSKTGSYALSLDKTNTFFLLVDSALQEIAKSVDRDLISVIWELNGYPEEMKPTSKTAAMRHTDVEQITASLRDLADAGGLLDPKDGAIDEVREMLGISRRAPEILQGADILEDKVEGKVEGKVSEEVNDDNNDND